MAGTCTFVNFTTPNSEEEHLHNRYLIRACTVKNNRRKQLQAENEKQEEYSARKTNGSARKLLPLRGLPPPKLDTELAASSEKPKETANSAKKLTHRDDDQVEQCRNSTASDIVLSLSPSATIFPLFGAFAADTFDCSSYATVLEISVRVFNLLFSRVFTPTEISAYWVAYCQNPLFFYSYAHLHLFVSDNVHSRIDGRARARKYALNIKITALLLEALPTLRDEDVEPVLLAMTLMARPRDDTDVKLLSAQSTLFQPYQLYGDLLEAFQAGHIESFVPAVRTLVTRIGGLHRLKTPSLSKMIHMNGLVLVSSNCDAPYFGNRWNTQRLLAAQGAIWDFSQARTYLGMSF